MSVKLLVCPTWQSTELMLEATLWKNVLAGIVLDVRRPSGRRRSRNGGSSVSSGASGGVLLVAAAVVAAQ